MTVQARIRLSGLGAGILLLSLAACAIPPHDELGSGPGACLVVASAGFRIDRNCTPFELSWIPGARRLTVGQRGADDVHILEISGRHREITVRRVRPGTYCALAYAYPNPLVTRNCRSTDPAHPPTTIISVRG